MSQPDFSAHFSGLSLAAADHGSISQWIIRAQEAIVAIRDSLSVEQKKAAKDFLMGLYDNAGGRPALKAIARPFVDDAIDFALGLPLAS